ncbi:MAG TPA: RNA polymerase sigma factor SigJ [Acidimicrobiales bacterium]
MDQRRGAVDLTTAPGGAASPLEQVLLAERAHYVGLAYRITGSRLDAEDVVQEAWERARRTDASPVDRPAAWLTTVVSRLALDHLRAAQRRRETYVGPWLPEPVLTAHGAAAAPSGTDDPAHLAEMAESLTFGFLRVLEALSPVERVVFVLADVFGVPFPEIARAVGRTPDACRQVATRARSRVGNADRRHHAPGDAARIADDLVDALARGDAEQVLSLLAPDVELVTDGGAAVQAARRPVVGRDRVARLLLSGWRRFTRPDQWYEHVEVNGDAGILVHAAGEPAYAVAFTFDGGRLQRIYAVANPAKLDALRLGGGIA